MALTNNKLTLFLCIVAMTCMTHGVQSLVIESTDPLDNIIESTDPLDNAVYYEDTIVEEDTLPETDEIVEVSHLMYPNR